MPPTNTTEESRAVLATNIVFFVLAIFAVAGRLTARFGVLKNGGRDEIAILISLAALTCVFWTSVKQWENGLGYHMADLPPHNVSEVQRWTYASTISYNITLTFTKISIIMQYLRVFVGPKITKASWITMALVVAFGLEATITAIFACTPIRRFWDPTVSGSCIRLNILWFFNGGFNIFTDILIIALPMPIINSLKLPKKQKIGLMLVFALGGFVCIVSILRLTAMYKAVYKSTDVTWEIGPTTWSTVETCTGVICACLPTFKPIVLRFFPRLLSSTRRQNTAGYYHHSQGRDLKSISQRGKATSSHDSSPNTTTRVEAAQNQNYDEERASDSFDKRNDIFVMTSMTQDVERKSEPGSEKELIIQRP